MDIESLWSQLEKFNLTSYSNGYPNSSKAAENSFKENTARFSIFNQNIVRALVPYDLVANFSEKENNNVNISYQYFCEMMLINLVTSLEVYLKDVFYSITPNVTVDSIIDKSVFVQFLKKLNITDRYLEVFSEFNGNNYPISKIIPKRIDFQQKKKLKISYRMLGIELGEITNKTIWNNIFDKDTGYIAKRHKIIHMGFAETIQSHKEIDVDFVAKAALDICTFIYELDKKIVFEFPKNKYPMLYFQKVE